MIDKEIGVLAQYKCGWCLRDFEHRAIKSGVKSSNLNHQMKQVSNTVTCPFCLNNARTWDDIKKVIRPLENGK